MIRTLPITELGTILSIWAHPDDETYLAGGVMAAARDAGQRVVCATATLGEHGTPDPAVWPPERLGPVRRWEATAAMAVLGVAEHRILGLPDGELPRHATAGQAWVAGLIAEVEPATILTFGPDGATFHPDHIAVNEWVTAAWDRHGRRARLLHATGTREFVGRVTPTFERLGAYMTDQRPLGVTLDERSVHLRLDGHALDRKVAALRAMATQTGDLLAAVGLPCFSSLVDEETFRDGSC